MILTGKEIEKSVRNGDVVISPFSEKYLDPNSYSFHLGPTIIEYENEVVDAKEPNLTNEKIIPVGGMVLYPDKFYLGSTYEKIGSKKYASELYANLSTATSGMFIQTSAPLGHTGAIVNWTLEIVVSNPIVVYPLMIIGKVCFWENFGEDIQYSGRYLGSQTVVPSMIAHDYWEDR